MGHLVLSGLQILSQRPTRTYKCLKIKLPKQKSNYFVMKKKKRKKKLQGLCGNQAGSLQTGAADNNNSLLSLGLGAQILTTT